MIPTVGKEAAVQYEVLFDEEFLGGLSLRCSPNRAYCLPPSCVLNLSYGARMKAEKHAVRYQHQSAQQSYVGGFGGHILGPQPGARAASFAGVVTGGRGGHAPFRQGQYHQQYANEPVSCMCLCV